MPQQRPAPAIVRAHGRRAEKENLQLARIPVCLWFLARDKKNHKRRDRRGKTHFIDARKMGVLIDRVHRELTADEIKKASDCYHARKSKGGASVPASRGKEGKGSSVASHHPPYQDEPGFCKSERLEEISTHGCVLTPGRYVGAADVEEESEPFGQKMKRLTATLEEQFAESTTLEKAIRRHLAALDFKGDRSDES